MSSRCCLVCLLVSMYVASVSHAASGDDMVRIPAGSFTMGSETHSRNTRPKHQVYVDAFYMDKYETTQGAYASLMKVNPSEVRKEDIETIMSDQHRLSVGPNYPVTRVSWTDAAKYCNARSRNEGLEPCYDESTWICDFGRNGYRLPTEAEWEYACRAGTNTECWWGDRIEDGTGCMNCADETKRPDGKQWVWRLPFSDGYWNVSPVGSFKANPWGLYDTIGNVWEWCADLYGGYPSETTTDPKGALTGDYRVTRGGSWGCFPWGCRSACRDYQSAKNAADSLGFRVVRLAYP